MGDLPPLIRNPYNKPPTIRLMTIPNTIPTIEKQCEFRPQHKYELSKHQNKTWHNLNQVAFGPSTLGIPINPWNSHQPLEFPSTLGIPINPWNSKGYFFFDRSKELSCWIQSWTVMCRYLEDHPRTRKWLVTPIYKPFRPFGMGTTLLRGLINHGY